MTTTVLAYISSPSQGVWHVFGVPLRAYALFIIVGIISALVIGDRRWVARGGEPGVIYDVALWAVPFGLLGGRLYHVITDWRTYFGEDGAGFVGALRIWDGGLGIWGAVALGGVGAWIACRRRGIPLPAFGDAIAPGIVLAQAIGRLGNYFNQELFGRQTTVPWGLEIYERTNAAGEPDMLNGVSTGQLLYVVHPTFLYELLWNLLVFAALILIDRKFRIGHGRLFAMYVAGYCLGRFWIELLRSDTATLLAGIRINSFTATFVFIGAVVYIMAAPRGREDPATLRGDQDVEDESDVEEFAKKLTGVAATTGVVAAAKVAGEDEKSVAEAAEADSVPDTAGLGSVETDELAASVQGASDVPEPAAPLGSGDAVEAEESEADAVLVAESEVADPDSVTAVEDVDEADAEPMVEAEGGLGSVDGDELIESVEGASDAHDSAVQGEADAEALVAEVAAEDVAAAPGGDALVAESEVVDSSVEAGSADAADEVMDASDAHGSAVDGEADAELLADEVAAADAAEVESGGVGSVDGDEVAESVVDASDAHESAVEGEADAESLADEVAAEDVAAAPEGDALVAESEVEDSGVEAVSADAVGGLGSVEGDEVVDASDAHESAVEGEAEAELLADEVAAADAAEVESGGVGSVDGDEVAESVVDASDAHESAVEGEADAESLADEVAAEDVAAAPEGDALVAESEVEDSGVEAVSADAVGGLGSVEGDEVVDASDAHESAVEGEAEAESLGAEVAAEDADADSSVESGGVGSVDGDEVAESVVDAPDAHESAVEGEAAAESLAADIEAEEPDAEAESGGVGSVDGDEAAESVDDASDAHESAVEGETEALAADDDSGADSEATNVSQPAPTFPKAPTPARTPTPTRIIEAGGRAREWLRRRRNR